MKKVKIMLFSLALLAVVGGALAFKAKYDGSKYCTSTFVQGQVNPPVTCSLLVTTSKTNGLTTMWTTTPTTTLSIDPVTGGNSIISTCFITPPSGISAPIGCNASTKLTRD